MAFSKLQKRAALFGILLVMLLATEALDRYQPSSFSQLLKVIMLLLVSCLALYFAIVAARVISQFSADDARKVRDHLIQVITKKKEQKRESGTDHK